MWGKGIYFAKNASYSCPGYSHLLPGTQNTYQVFLADVAVGKFIETGTNNAPYKSLTKEPDGYDSVKGNTCNSDVYMVYENVKAYPTFLVQY